MSSFSEEVWERLFHAAMRHPTFLRYLFLLVPAASSAEVAVEMALAVEPSYLVWARNDQFLISMGMYGEARVWEAATGKQLHTLPSSKNLLAEQLVASPDGEWIGTIDNGKAIITNRRTRKVVWSSEEVVVKLTGLTSSSVILAIHKGDYADRVARIQWPEGKVIAEWKAPGNCLFGHIHSISQGRTAVCLGGRTTYILDKNLQETARIAPKEPAPSYFSRSSSQGSWISYATSQGARLVNADEPEKGPQEVKSLRGWTYLPSPDGSRWFGGRTGQWAIYDQHGKSIAAAELVEDVFEEGVAWSADGGTLAVPSSEGIQLIHARTGKRIRKFGTKHLGHNVFDGREAAALSSAGRMQAIKTPAGDWSILDFDHPLEWKLASELASQQPRHSSRTDSFILSKPGGWQRYENGALEPLKVQRDSSVFDVERIGDSLWLRSNNEMTVYSFGHGNEPTRQSFPLFVTRSCVASPDAQWALHQSQDEKQLVLRRAPDWQVVAEFTLPHGAPTALLASPDGDHFGWADGNHHWWSYSLGSAGPENKRTLSSGSIRMGCFTHPTGPNMAVCWDSYQSTVMGQVVDAKGQVKYRFGSWKHFTDEINPVPLGFGPSQKHLWLCGMGVRPMLVDLASGQPLLRLHYLANGVPLWEMASGKFYGPEAAKAHLRWTDFNTTRDLSASERAAVWSEREFRAVMKAYLGDN